MHFKLSENPEAETSALQIYSEHPDTIQSDGQDSPAGRRKSKEALAACKIKFSVMSWVSLKSLWQLVLIFCRGNFPSGVSGSSNVTCEAAVGVNGQN